MSDYYYPSVFSPMQGWNCHRCGAFVPDGCTHSCPTMVWVNPPPPKPWPDPLDRVAAALERIAAALEEAGRGGKNPPT
jgi:hypothetical protein